MNIRHIKEVALLIVVVAIVMQLLPANTTTYQQQPEPQPNDIDIQLNDVRKFVEKGLQEKNTMDINQALADRAYNVYLEAQELADNSTRAYNLTLDAMALYGNGTLDIYFEVAQGRGLIKE